VIEHPQDLALVQTLLAGDEREFARFFADYYPRLFRFAFTRLNSDADTADEVAQRTLCRAVRKLHLYRAEASLFTWLCQICRHEIHDLLETRNRRDRRHISIDDDPDVRAALESLPADRQHDPAGVATRTELLALVQLVLDYLPPRYADALEWKYVEDLGVQEIAQRLDLSVHAAESLLARARRSFREAWLTVTGDALPEILTGQTAP
jgi:RNA polymerase sigma-70 factor (ECF subfamily)